MNRNTPQFNKLIASKIKLVETLFHAGGLDISNVTHISFDESLDMPYGDWVLFVRDIVLGKHESI